MEGLRLIVSIVERGTGIAIQKLYSQHQVFLHTQCLGKGTATSEIMDILGLGSSEKTRRGRVRQLSVSSFYFTFLILMKLTTHMPSARSPAATTPNHLRETVR